MQGPPPKEGVLGPSVGLEMTNPEIEKLILEDLDPDTALKDPATGNARRIPSQLLVPAGFFCLGLVANRPFNTMSVVLLAVALGALTFGIMGENIRRLTAEMRHIQTLLAVFYVNQKPDASEPQAEATSPS